MRPTLDSLAVAHHTLTDEATMSFIVDRSIKQAVATQSAGGVHSVAAVDRRQSLFRAGPAMTAKSALTKWQSVKTLNRSDLTKRLVAKLTHDEAVVGGIGNTNFDLFAAGHRPQNFYMLGSMGLACPIALGVALAQPKRGVIALEGDGSILMALGCLATIGMIRPKNLTIVIMDNGIYQITGGQTTATKESADIVAIAQGAGIENSYLGPRRGAFRAADRSPVRGGRPRADRRQDRRLSRPIGQTVRDPLAIRTRFMQGLGTGRRSPLDVS